MTLSYFHKCVLVNAERSGLLRASPAGNDQVVRLSDSMNIYGLIPIVRHHGRQHKKVLLELDTWRMFTS